MSDHEIIWHLCGITLVAGMFIVGQKVRQIHSTPLFFYHLCGTLCHEASHVVCAKLTGARVVGFTLLPKRDGNRVVLGSVSLSSVNAFNAVPIALAPLGLIVVAVVAFSHWYELFPNTFASTIARYFLTYLLVYNSLPSWQDFRMAMNWGSIVLYGALLIVAFCCSCEQPPLPPENRTALNAEVQQEEQAIELVQQYPSAVEGVTVLECITDILKRSKKMRKQVTVLGWEAVRNDDGYDDVFFRSLENERPLDFHWRVKDRRVVPADEFTRAIMSKKMLLI